MKRGSARSLLEAGIDPSAQRRESKAGETLAASSTFGLVAAEVLANKEANEAASATLEHDAFKSNRRHRHCEQSEAIQTWGLRRRLSLDCVAVARNDG